MAATLFTWGYWGSGNATRRWIEVVDAVEAARGFAPPLFVDLRIQRSVRAAGFRDRAFEELLGPGRHVWMRELGNDAVRRKLPGIVIKDPAAAGRLLDLSLDEARSGRRVIGFCACEWPRTDGRISCHRETVAELVRAEAERRGISVEVIEWPGGDPSRVVIPTTPETLAAVARGRRSIPVQEPADLAELGGLPWGSIATLRSSARDLEAVSGPLRYTSGGWSLPVIKAPEGAARARAAFGLDRRI